MKSMNFADIVSNYITFNLESAEERLLCRLIDSRWVQRLRDISQTGNTRLVYMFSEHSRFGHSLGVAYLAKELLAHLEHRYPSKVKPWKAAVLTAALLHDVGHLAPGSHTAFKVWYPNEKDCHEEIAVDILQNDEEISGILKNYSHELQQKVCAILAESDSVPAWCWQSISGAGWNVDRGNWLIADSVLAGVSYGKYNIQALLDSVDISDSNALILRENRLDAMLHFALSRHAMYRQVYLHRVTLGADALAGLLVKRARETVAQSSDFADAVMAAVLSSRSPKELALSDIFEMREAWWRYHLLHWTKSTDGILADLADRFLHRRLLKTIRKKDEEDISELLGVARSATEAAGYNPDYYCIPLIAPTMHGSESKRAIEVRYDDGSQVPLIEADPLFPAMIESGQGEERVFVMLPEEAKQLLKRAR